MELVEALKLRRTHKKFDGTPISEDVLKELLECAMTAPNHRRNEPWRFTVIKHDQLESFWQKLVMALGEAYPDLDAESLQRKKEDLEYRILKLGALVYVTCTKDSSLAIERENYAACSCAIQNLMLAATAKQIGSFWNTGAVFSCSTALKILNIHLDKEFFVGAVWLGYAADHPVAPVYHNEANVRFWTGHGSRRDRDSQFSTKG